MLQRGERKRGTRPAGRERERHIERKVARYARVHLFSER